MPQALRKGFPGVNFAFSQYIQDNVQEAASGIDAENAIKISGADLAARCSKVAADDPPRARERARASPTSRCRRCSASRPSASTSTASAPRATACRPATSTPPSRPRSAARRRATSTRTAATATFPMKVRLAPQYRHDMEALQRIAIGVPGRTAASIQVPLSEVANVGLSSGAFYIYREQQERFIPVKFSVRGRDLGGAVLEAQQKVAEEVPLPAATGSNGPATSPTSRTRSTGCRSPCRSPSP